MALPLIQAVLLALVGIAAYAFTRKWIALLPIAAGFGWLILCGTPSFAGWLRDALIVGPTVYAMPKGQQPDAVIVLGGDRVPASVGDSNDDADADPSTRIELGVALSGERHPRVMLLSGGYGEAARMAQAMGGRAATGTQLRLETRSTSTHENAVYSGPILREFGVRSVIVVTSAAHLTRATRAFAKQGFVVYGAAVAPPPYRVSSHWLSRTRTAWYVSGKAMHERLALWGYILAGWA
ncbi:YdcF family protein [Bacillus sp. NP157]|nr:YdcF family protein [Bacillus sp. NP157]